MSVSYSLHYTELLFSFIFSFQAISISEAYYRKNTRFKAIIMIMFFAISYEKYEWCVSKRVRSSYSSHKSSVYQEFTVRTFKCPYYTTHKMTKKR